MCLVQCVAFFPHLVVLGKKMRNITGASEKVGRCEGSMRRSQRCCDAAMLQCCDSARIPRRTQPTPRRADGATGNGDSRCFDLTCTFLFHCRVGVLAAVKTIVQLLGNSSRSALRRESAVHTYIHVTTLRKAVNEVLAVDFQSKFMRPRASRYCRGVMKCVETSTICTPVCRLCS